MNEHMSDHCSRRTPRRAATTASAGPPETAFAVIGRGRDRPLLEQLGQVQAIARGPSLHRDRTYTMFLVSPGHEAVDRSLPVANTGSPGVYR